MGNTTRGMAFCIILVVLIGTAIGSMLPETGNVLAHIFKLSESHAFNGVFLVIGIIGIVLALRLGFKQRG